MKYYPSHFILNGSLKIHKGNFLVTANPNQRVQNHFYFESNEPIDFYHSQEFADLIKHFSAKFLYPSINIHPFNYMPISRAEYQKAINSIV
jgi:hypothetical protein